MEAKDAQEDRRRKGLYSLVLVHGLPGTGKSSTCFRLIEKVEESFKDKLKIKVVPVWKWLLE